MVVAVVSEQAEGLILESKKKKRFSSEEKLLHFDPKINHNGTFQEKKSLAKDFNQINYSILRKVHFLIKK